MRIGGTHHGCSVFPMLVDSVGDTELVQNAEAGLPLGVEQCMLCKDEACTKSLACLRVARTDSDWSWDDSFVFSQAIQAEAS